MGESDPLRRLASLMLDQRYCHPFGGRIKQRDCEIGALPAARSPEQSFEYRLISGKSRCDVDDGDTDPGRRLRTAGQRSEPGIGLDQKIIGLALRVGSTRAIAADRAGDEPRILLAQPRRIEAELGSCAGLQILHEHIGFGDHCGE